MIEPIRILHVLGRLDRGGSETMIMNIYRKIDRTKIQFDFAIHTNEECDYSDEIRKLGGKIFKFPRYRGTNHLTYKRVWKEFFQLHTEYGIIHGHMRSTASIYLKIANSFGLCTISHSHSTSSRGKFIERRIKDMLQKPIRKKADYLFACSEDAGKWLFGRDVIHKKNFKIIKNAIDIQKFSYNEVVRNKIRSQNDLDGKFVLGHVGNFTLAKNHSFLLDVFYNIQKEQENAVLLLIGKGEIKEKMQKKAIKLGIDDKVIFLGAKSNVSDYIQAMDLFLFPSLFEGLGLAVIEAQASGVPCIVSDRLPQEVFVTKLVKKLSINSPKIWSDFILNRKFQRNNNNIKDIIQSGYDIEYQAKNLSDFYLARLNTK